MKQTINAKDVQQITSKQPPTKCHLPKEQWQERLQNHQQKEETCDFIEQLKHCFRTTQNLDMETEQNNMEYVGTVKHWRTTLHNR